MKFALSCFIKGGEKLFTNTKFIYDGVQSDYFGLMLVNMDTGIKNVPFGIERNVIEEKRKNKSVPYFFGVEDEPLYFKVTIAREDGVEWSDETRINVVRWLFQKEYKSFVSSDNIGIQYNCLVVDRPEKLLIGNIPRLIELTFKCDSSHAWSPILNNYYDLSTNTTSKLITMENRSNIQEYYYPEIWIKSIDGGSITLKNHSDMGREFKFVNLLPNETIYINNELRQIETDILSIYRLKDFVGRKWLRLPYGENNIEVTGKCLIKTRMQYPIGL